MKEIFIITEFYFIEKVLELKFCPFIASFIQKQCLEIKTIILSVKHSFNNVIITHYCLVYSKTMLDP